MNFDQSLLDVRESLDASHIDIYQSYLQNNIETVQQQCLKISFRYYYLQETFLKRVMYCKMHEISLYCYCPFI